RRANDPVSKLRQLLSNNNQRVILCADSAGRQETLAEMLREFDLAPEVSDQSLSALLQDPAPFQLVVAPLSNGFTVNSTELILLTENDLYPSQVRPGPRQRRRQQTADVEAMVRDLSELRAGDPVVHVQHGIGRYHGLVDMDLGQGIMEFLHLEYAG